MQLPTKSMPFLAALAAALLAALTAWWAAIAIENRSESAVRSKLLTEGISWARVSTNGLQVVLTGTAPNEAARARAVNLVGSVVQADRVRDELDVAAMRAIEAPRFSVEILRNDDEISLIGLVPGKSEETALAAQVADLSGGIPVSDMLETADYPAPENWQAALDFGLKALALLPRSKISIAADQVAITAISTSGEEKRKLETDIGRLAPEGVQLVLDISAPRPVLTPFTLRFVLDESGARFDACSADSERARDRILAAARDAGNEGETKCTIGLGVPSPHWAKAAELGIAAVKALGGGTITFSDGDVTLTSTPEITQSQFDRTVGELQTALPPAFSLRATLPTTPDAAAQGPAEFTATLNDKGMAELRGRLNDTLLRDAVDSFARAQFGADRVYTATRLDADLPTGWSIRVLAGLESLGLLNDGNLLVRADLVEIEGVTGKQDARDRISQILSDKLGQGQNFRINVRYDEKFDPLAAQPTPQECVAQLNEVMGINKISFAPGSAEIEGNAGQVIDALAEIFRNCPALELEIAGHTDSQGSEGGNQALSQARAEAVLSALIGRRVDTTGLSPRGYGEANPIADNGTETGREANRRIEFTLLGDPEAIPEPSPVERAEAILAEAQAEATQAEASEGEETQAEEPPPAENPTEATSAFEPTEETFLRPRRKP
ncbi:MAG: OmpA family protein [Pseudorhodobacter sp.]